MEILVNELSHIGGKSTEASRHNRRHDIPPGLHKALTASWELRGILPLSVWVIIHLHEASSGEGQSRHLQTSRYNEISIHHPHIQAPQDFLADLCHFILVNMGGHITVPATHVTGQLTYSMGAS